MDKRKAPTTNKELLEALDELLQQPEPRTPEEVNAVLIEAGYDPEKIAAKIQAVVERGLEESPLNWRNRNRELETEKKWLADFVPNANQPRKKLLEAIDAALSNLALKNPQLAMVHHRNFESATDEDLASLLADIYYLDASQDKPTDSITSEE